VIPTPKPDTQGALIVQSVTPNGPADRSGLIVRGDLLHRLDYRSVRKGVLMKDVIRESVLGKGEGCVQAGRVEEGVCWGRVRGVSRKDVIRESVLRKGNGRVEEGAQA
jgi:hypothetical protein